MSRVAIVGTVGVPARYGGFETLAENLVLYNAALPEPHALTVYCSAKAYANRPRHFQGARLRYLPLEGNGAQSLLYDFVSVLDAVIRRTDTVILLGHGGSFVLPLLKRLTRTRFITNIDGIEWKRDKWSPLARRVLKSSEAFAVRHSHVVIADNEAIGDYVEAGFGRDCTVIPYGGDHALAAAPDPAAVAGLPERYALALCRIEPENNVAMILEAFAGGDMPLVFVGNWDRSDYGRALKARFADVPGVTIHDPVYEPGALRAIRDRAALYVHGHSAGGTNPALVEMMQFAIPVVAHGCAFNRYSTEDKARYFLTADELAAAVAELKPEASAEIGAAMVEIARRRYTWAQIGRAYFELLES